MDDVPPDRCQSYAAGHQMHWIHWKHVQESEPATASVVCLDKAGIVLRVEDGSHPELTFWHHDLDRLGSLLRADATIWVYPRWHALQVGPHLFNCSTRPDSSSMCRLRSRGIR